MGESFAARQRRTDWIREIVPCYAALALAQCAERGNDKPVMQADANH
jgi:hypothetical protein